MVAVEGIKTSCIKSMALCMPWDLKTHGIVLRLPDAAHAQWLVLDKVFVGYLAARSLKLKVAAAPVTGIETLEVFVKWLLPNPFGKGMLEMPRVV